MDLSTHHDINKFPKGWGIVVFPISMSRIGNAQAPQTYLDALEFFADKVVEPQVGINFLYTEGLYMNLEQDAYVTKNKFGQNAVSHMQGVRNLLAKNFMKFQITEAYHFESWFQMYLSHKDFFSTFKKVKDVYAEDPEFQKHVALDAKAAGKELTDRQVDFYLEEHTVAYLLLHGQLSLRNTFVANREEWILLAYPGAPARGQIYLTQKNPLKFRPLTNPYIGQYDLSAKKFIDYLKVDLSTTERSGVVSTVL